MVDNGKDLRPVDAAQTASELRDGEEGDRVQHAVMGHGKDGREVMVRQMVPTVDFGDKVINVMVAATNGCSESDGQQALREILKGERVLKGVEKRSPCSSRSQDGGLKNVGAGGSGVGAWEAE